MSKAGGALAKGIEDIYKQAQLAKNRGGLDSNYRAQLASLNNQSTNAMDKMNNEVRVRLERNLRALNTTTSNSVAKNFDKIKDHYGRLKDVLSKPMRDSLFGGVGGKAGMEGQLQIAQNMQRMDAVGRAEVIRNQGKIIRQTEQELQLAREKFIELEKAGEEKVKERDKQAELVAKLQEEVQLQKDIKQNFVEIDQEITGITNQYGDLNSKAAQFAQKTLQTADAIRNKFNEALRTSVSLLTVVGYKLNQSTQDLISFERELLNANSVFNLTNDQLFTVGNTVTEFGNQFGIAVHNGAEGLYQLASAGLEANEAMQILPETLKLSMAVQGDHNTISKLTAQTLFGFGMEMDQAALLTDKFAFAIQKSLIEYEDLSSAVKFALPFFTSTGQSIDQLLGALQILTNRALEAGIAGRGLRQALAEFAESALDAEVGFRKMGVEILNAEGEMMQLTEIAAQFAAAVGPETASNTELLTTLIEDLNVRGATAFIHLVQASDEFTEAVNETRNAGGQLDEMVRIQNQSLQAQIQILKTNIFSIFALRDASYEGTEFMNAFHEAIVTQIQGFKDLIVEEKNGQQQLTEFGAEIQKFATESVTLIIDLIQDFLNGIIELQKAGVDFAELLEIISIPLKVIAALFREHPTLMKWFLVFKALNTILPVQTVAVWALTKAYGALATAAFTAQTAQAMQLSTATGVIGVRGKALKNVTLAGGGLNAAGRKAVARGGTAVGGKMIAKETGKFGAKRLLAGTLLAGTGVGGLVLGGMLAYDIAKATGVLQSGGYVPGMAAGGGMGGGRPHLVGEMGPELFIPSQSGKVLNNSQTENMLSGKVVFKDVTIGVDSFGGLA
jgi:TP901 family phage tail tape measure protein